MTPARREQMLDVIHTSTGCLSIRVLQELQSRGFAIVDRHQLRRVLRRSREQTHEARRQRDRAVARLADVISFDGASHDDPECPEDDTCSCANVRDINEILGRAPLTADTGSRMSSARAEAWRLKEDRNAIDAQAWRDFQAGMRRAGIGGRSLPETLERLMDMASDAKRWCDHEAACKAAGREPTLEKTDGEPR